ncbi:probable mitochondrial saccharopine dehydrogenase-like oxidoreductase At5g39410 [Phalaenopsis equestris]|uniref:probable mitochondrial saccharopine dehydrogenase-like oxidoreductase At5g39410 n=1 Tax=Phalaenopsis equestris TaxID=78828 RepID=UPI0009E4CEEB|nr:probable mitochondrial saccharopine dehydrogenase-like oxidoreductase At5g39410 [Phalaenopsis equestris]
MASDFDLVIFGASGFTGKYVIREALKFFSSPTCPFKTLALAGRNPSKISESLAWAASPSSPPPIPIISADVSDRLSLLNLFRRTRLVLNCVGPFRLYGDPVVAACVEVGTDYLDISGEPEFMERMELQYHEMAKHTGALVISACGFDSIPAEMGFIFHSRQWEPPAAANRVEAYVVLESERSIVGNIGTYMSAVLGVANASSLQELRRSKPRRARPQIPGPPFKPKSIEKQKSLALWALKLPSADAIVVRRTLAALTENPEGLQGADETDEHAVKRRQLWLTIKPAHFGVKIGSKSPWSILRFMITGLFIGLLGMFAFGRKLLLKFPAFFSLGGFSNRGPTEEEVDSASFKMWFVGEGYSDVRLAAEGKAKPDTEIITRVSGPEIGYVTTPIILIQCAFIVLSQRHNLPKGGVYPPGIIFGTTNLQERLEANGVCFDFVSKRSLRP